MSSWFFQMFKLKSCHGCEKLQLVIILYLEQIYFVTLTRNILEAVLRVKAVIALRIIVISDSIY